MCSQSVWTNIFLQRISNLVAHQFYPTFLQNEVCPQGRFPEKDCCSFGFCQITSLPHSPQFGQLVQLFLNTKNIDLSEFRWAGIDLGVSPMGIWEFSFLNMIVIVKKLFEIFLLHFTNCIFLFLFYQLLFQNY